MLCSEMKIEATALNYVLIFMFIFLQNTFKQNINSVLPKVGVPSKEQRHFFNVYVMLIKIA